MDVSYKKILPPPSPAARSGAFGEKASAEMEEVFDLSVEVGEAGTVRSPELILYRWT